MESISAIIVVKNDPPHLFETLESITDFVSEIIIGDIDIGNEYKKRLLENKKVKIVNLPSSIPFADLVKEDLKKNAKGEYILYLDPDEIFPTISSRGRSPFGRNNQQLTFLLQQYDYFYFPRKNIIFGKWIEHSRWWPDYQLRLFKKNSVIWPKELHPIPKVKGKEYKFEVKEENAILHYNYDNLDQYLKKAIRYAKYEATSLIQKKENYTLDQALKKGMSEFISRFFANDGYKDGMHGFVLSILQMFYYFLVYFYYWEDKKFFHHNQEDLVNSSQNYFKRGLKETNFWLINKKLAQTFERIKLKILNKLLGF